MRRTIILAGLLLTLALIASACAGEAPTSSPPATSAPAVTSAPAATNAPVATNAPAATSAPAATAAPAAADDWGTITVKKGDTIKVDVAAALSGDLAPFGQDIVVGAQMGAADFGKDVAPGFNIEITSDDDQCSGAGSTSVANKVAADPQIAAVIGFMCSSGDVPGTEILDKAHVVSISPSATAAKIVLRGLETVNRTAFSDKIQGVVDADYLSKQLKLTSIAIIHDGSIYGEGLGEVVRDEFTKQGGKVTDFEAITVGEKDFRATLTKIAANKPQGIFFGGFHPEAAVLVTQKAEVGLKDAVFMSADGTYSPKFMDEAKDAAEGVYTSFGSAAQGSSYGDYVKAYVAKGGNKDNIVFSPQAYDGAKVLALALKSVAQVDADGNLVIGRHALAKAVRAVKTDGVTGPIAFDSTGDRPPEATNVVVYQVKAAKWVQIFPAAQVAIPPLPDGALQQKGKLLVCTDAPYPPMEFFDENGNPTGSDVEIGQELGKRLGVQAQFINSVFDTIILAVSGGKCDIILSDMNITADRHKQVSFIAYFKAGQSMLVAKGNPKNISTPIDTCGTSVAAESGTTEVDYLNGTGDYKGKGLSDQCKAAGKQAVDAVVTQKDSDALQQLQAGKVTVYFADTPVAAYYVVQNPDQFQLVGSVIEPILVGLALPCGQPDCTKAPLTPLGQSVKAALLNMMADGTYSNILTKYKLQDGAVTPDDVNQ